MTPDPNEALVHVDLADVGGRPVFVGTRVPIDIVLACIDAGDAAARLQATYPFLTLEHIAAAREWIECKGLAPRSKQVLAQNGSKNCFSPDDLRSLPFHFDNPFAKAAKLRRSRESSLHLEPKVQCEIRVQDKSEEEILGVLTTFARQDDKLSVVCRWQGEERETFPTMLEVHQTASPWEQLFCFVVALTGEFALEAFPSLAAGKWHTAILQMPDVDGPGVNDLVSIAVDANSWVASLTSTRSARQAAEVAVPEELREENIGRLLVAAASMLLLGRSWWAA